MNESRQRKIEAAREALCLVRDGMGIGMGTGSTAEEFARLLAGRIEKENLRIRAIATSSATEALCRELSIPLSDLDEEIELDIAVDGADEIDPDLSLVKGGGGALLREKIVAKASREFIVIADETKKVDVLGRFGVPVELDSFGVRSTLKAIREASESLGMKCSARLRESGSEPFLTDGGHWIADIDFGLIPEPSALDRALNAIPGVLEHGLFVSMAKRALIASEAGIEKIEGDEN